MVSSKLSTPLIISVALLTLIVGLQAAKAKSKLEESNMSSQRSGSSIVSNAHGTFILVSSKDGLLVSSDSSPRKNSTLLSGDVILSINELRTETPEDLMSYVRDHREQKTYDLKIIRKGVDRDIEVERSFFNKRMTPKPPSPPAA